MINFKFCTFCYWKNILTVIGVMFNPLNNAWHSKINYFNKKIISNFHVN